LSAALASHTHYPSSELTINEMTALASVWMHAQFIDVSAAQSAVTRSASRSARQRAQFRCSCHRQMLRRSRVRSIFELNIGVCPLLRGLVVQGRVNRAPHCRELSIC